MTEKTKNTHRRFAPCPSIVLFAVLSGLVDCSGGNDAADTDTDDDGADTLEEATLAAYDEVAERLSSMKALAESAASDSETDANRKTYQDEIDSLVLEINDLTETAVFGDRQVLFGSSLETLSTEGTYSAFFNNLQPIEDAVNLLGEGNQTVEITFSFVIAGTSVVDLGTTYAALDLEDQSDGSVTHEEFKQDIREALAVWEDLFEKTFNPANGYGGNLNVTFTDLGDETGTSRPVSGTSGTYEVPGDENLGMFRYAMISSMSTANPYSPTGSPSGGIDDSSGDIAFSSNVNWRQDREDGVGSSVEIVAAHEMGHGFGFNHDTSSTNNMMNPANITQDSVHDLFPDGLFYKEGGSEAPGIVAIYGSGAELTDPEPYDLADGSKTDLPAVNAAVLGVNAIKVRTEDEAEESVTLIEDAEALLQGYRTTVEAL